MLIHLDLLSQSTDQQLWINLSQDSRFSQSLYCITEEEVLYYSAKENLLHIAVLNNRDLVVQYMLSNRLPSNLELKKCTIYDSRQRIEHGIKFQITDANMLDAVKIWGGNLNIIKMLIPHLSSNCLIALISYAFSTRCQSLELLCSAGKQIIPDYEYVIQGILEKASTGEFITDNPRLHSMDLGSVNIMVMQSASLNKETIQKVLRICQYCSTECYIKHADQMVTSLVHNQLKSSSLSMLLDILSEWNPLIKALRGIITIDERVNFQVDNSIKEIREECQELKRKTVEECKKMLDDAVKSSEEELGRGKAFCMDMLRYSDFCSHLTSKNHKEAVRRRETENQVTM